MLTIDMITLERIDEHDAHYCSVQMGEAVETADQCECGAAVCTTLPTLPVYWQEQARMAQRHADMFRQAARMAEKALEDGDVAAALAFVRGALVADAEACAVAARGEVLRAA